MKEGYKPTKPSEKEELDFFLDRSGRVKFYKKCNECEKTCKQSHKIKGLKCPCFVKKMEVGKE